MYMNRTDGLDNLRAYVMTDRSRYRNGEVGRERDKNDIIDRGLNPVQTISSSFSFFLYCGGCEVGET